MSTTTYELLEEAARLLAAIAAAETDEEADAILARALAWEGELPDRLARLRAVQVRAEAETALLDAEERRLRARRQRCEATRGRVRGMAASLLVAHRELQGGDGRVVAPTLTARLQRSPPRLDAPRDPSGWPAAYTYQVPALDRDHLRADLEAGIEVPGCALVRGEHDRWG